MTEDTRTAEEEQHAPVELHGELCGWCIHGPPALCDCGADLFYGRLTDAGFTVARLKEVESTDLAEAVTNAERRGLPYDLLFDGMALYRIVDPK